ncbi:MAG: tetratricopeptide repeat protein, partial [Asgard group archaeon]|nr:tetratricopeptide repeat protein [Asgard group archaeon]
MDNPILEELLTVESLLEDEKYKDALTAVDEFLQQKNLSSNNQLVAKLLKSRILTKRKKLDEAQKIIEKLWPKISKQENPFLRMDYLIVKTEISWVTGKFDEGIDAIEKSKEFIEKSETKFVNDIRIRFMQRKSELLQHCGIVLWYKGNLDKALELLLECLRLNEELGNKIKIAGTLNNIGLIYNSKSDYKLAIEYYEKALTISEELGNKRQVGTVLSNIGNIYAQQGDLNRAHDYMQQSLVLRKELGSKKGINITLINLGVIFQFKGDLSQALKYYQESLNLSKEIGYKQDIALALNNIGTIHNLKGELDQAYKHLKQSFDLYKELDLKEKIALSNLNMGEYYEKKDNLVDAAKHYQQSLAIHEELGNEYGSSIVLFELITLELERNDIVQSKLYLEKLKKFSEQSDSRTVDHHYRVANALILKASDNARDRMKASVIFENVVKEEITNHSLTVTAMVHLCDLLLSDLKMTGDTKLFKEIKNLTYKLHEIAEKQNSFSLLVETFRLEANLALVELDLKRAKQLLEDALELANEKGLEKIVSQIQDEQRKLEEQIELWEELSKRKAPIEETLEHVHIEE